WNHYPVQLIPSDGTRTVLHDRTASFCPSTFKEFRRRVDEKTIEAMQIYGLTKLKPEELLSLNRFWNFTPQIIITSGREALEYHKAE
ncbi:hypothetical protein KA005_32025, partial [bacterium]|nr:hypothetical protein [bacterium]